MMETLFGHDVGVAGPRKRIKKALVILFVLLFSASPALADDVSKGLSGIATKQVQDSTRQIISLGIEKDQAIRMTRLMVQHHFDDDQVMRAHRVLVEAKKEALPLNPIFSKAYEGMAKHVRAKNIVRAMETVRSRYSFAYSQARQITRDKAHVQQVGNTIAECLAAGMSHKDVAQIMGTLHQRAQSLTKTQANKFALETLMFARSMARHGTSSTIVSHSVRQALEKASSAKQMHEMRDSFMMNSLHPSSRQTSQGHSGMTSHGNSARSHGMSFTGKGKGGDPGDMGHGDMSGGMGPGGGPAGMSGGMSGDMGHGGDSGFGGPGAGSGGSPGAGGGSGGGPGGGGCGGGPGGGPGGGGSH